jgi:hypothetical protein
MRLTLRTLLAYMDGLLDPKDSQEIGKKIEGSKFASDLFHKIRDVMRRLRLAAPSVTERGTNLDCNTVAEYLDNALPADHLPDFEEVCLKSEMHLAEVASCHQILTMVLGEPVEIDPEGRQRMYQLPTVANRVDEERLAAVEAASVLSGDGNSHLPPAVPAKSRPRPVVPEYLRDPPKKSRLLPAAAITLLVGAAVALTLIMTGQFNEGTPLGNYLLKARTRFFSKNDEDDHDAKIVPKKSASELGDSTAFNSGALPKSSGSASAAANPTSVSAGTATSGNLSTAGSREGPSLIPEDSAGNSALGQGPAPAGSGKSPLITAPANVAPGPLSSTGSVAMPAGPDRKPGSGELPATAPAAGPEVTSTASKAAPGNGPADGGPVSPIPSDGVAKVDPRGSTKPGPNTPPVGPAADQSKIGRFISDGQDVLLSFQAGTSDWRRVLPEEFLPGRQALLALPSYRPRVVVLNVGATLELVNGARIELLRGNAPGQSGVDVDFGRVVIKPLAQAGARLLVVVGSHSGTITLTNVESIAALEVTRSHDPGKDPEKALSHALTKLYVARGGAIWDEGQGNPPVQLTAPAELYLDGASTGSPPGSPKEIPKWITINTVNESDQRAALSVSQALPADRAASLGLMELTEDRRKEVRWLATRCLGYLGQFDPLTAALNDIEFRREWPEYVDQLKQAIARGPETAAAIRLSIERKYGNDATALCRMLWGYTDKDLEDGEDARLVKNLSHESPVFRVLAFENLREITHQGWYYKADVTAAKRASSVQQWQRQQQAGRIRWTLADVRPRNAPIETLPRGSLPEPPKPLDGGATGGMKPLNSAPRATAPGARSGDRPLVPDAKVRTIAPPERLPVAIPEPEPPERRPAVTVPEPPPGN